MKSRIGSYRVILIIATLVALSTNGMLVGLMYWYAASLPTVDLTGLWVEDDNLLCPGEALDYKFTLEVSKEASVSMYTSDIKILPSAGQRPMQFSRLSYTRLQELNFEEPTELEIVRHFILPTMYLDARSMLETPWTPGSYIQRTTANVIGRSEQAVIDVPFTVNEECVTRGH